MYKRLSLNLPVLLILLMTSCQAGTKKNDKALANPQPKNVVVPVFNADSAYQYVKTQTLFGPRVPNTKAHEACKEYLVYILKNSGAKVTQQTANLEAFDGTILKSTNIIASIRPKKEKRILLCAHWDSRPWADNDPNPKNWHTPILGANDGASGVGVLLEIARILKNDTIKHQKLDIGVDIVLFDSEDYGTPKFYEGPDKEDSWCLGSQYWAKKLYKSQYKAKYGILLDMVGDQNASFLYEYYSYKFANNILQKVWEKADYLGHSNYFKPVEGGAITDDHVYVNKLTGIPCIDIIDCNPQTGFPATWHTLDDTMDNIDKNTLKAVGETLLNVLYSE